MKNFYGVLIFLNSFCIPCSGQTSDVEAVRLFGEGKFPVESVMERETMKL